MNADSHTNPESLPDTLPVETLMEALEGVRACITRAQAQMAELERTIVKAKEEEQLLQRLLALRRGGQPHGKDRISANSSALGFSKEHPAAITKVIDILERSGSPMHVSELMRLLRENNISIPGAGTQANLIAHLRRDGRIVRPSRGMYGLASWGLQEMPVTARRMKKRRRRTSRASVSSRN